MKKTFEGYLFNRIENMGNKKYNHIGCEGDVNDFGNFFISVCAQSRYPKKGKIYDRNIRKK
jgi:hypothetical protein